MRSLAFRKASICSRFSFSASCTLVVNPQHATRSRLILYWKLPPPSGSSCIGKDSPFDRATEIATIGHRERKSAMMIELPEKLEAALKVQANAHGISPEGYVCEVLERDLASALEGYSSGARSEERRVGKECRSRW